MLLLGVCDVPGASRAQSSRALDLQLFVPPASAGTGFGVDRTTVPRHGTWVIGLGASIALAPLERSGTPRETVVGHLATADALVALGLFEVLELSAALPLSWASVADDPLAARPRLEPVVGPGDARVGVKVPLVRGDLGLATRLAVSVPSGDSSRFLGHGHWTAMPALVASWQSGRTALGAETGFRLRRRRTLGDLEQDDELHTAVAASLALTDRLSAIVETQLRLGVGGRSFASAENPAEIDAGLRWTPTPALSLDVGAGTGLLAGYGAPLVRGLVVVRWATQRDRCPTGPEDHDGFLDDDHCADPDNDGDGLPDVRDECPNDAEDGDGFLDEDGCPDPDDDADGVPDAQDRCPRRSEDLDGHGDDDGCPELDNDEDGIADGLDGCPNDPEDRDQFQDDDGCPEPGPQQAVVTVTDTRILVSERIYFDFDTDVIRSVSMPLLDQVAQVILELPGQRRVRVEGHTDGEGDERYNLDLSFRRARAVVEYLAGRGVPRERLEYVGYGEQHPVAPNDSPEGRALNRRVEFTILEAQDVQEPARRPPREPQRRRTPRGEAPAPP